MPTSKIGLHDLDPSLFETLSNISGSNQSQTQIFPLQVVASADNQTIFPIELGTFDSETDFVFVQSGVTNLFYGADFTIENKNIILKEGVPAGRTLGIYILKNVSQIKEENYVTGANLAPNSVTPDKIGGVLPIEKGGTGATTVEEARMKLGGSNPNLLDNWYFADPINQRAGFYVPAGTEVCYTDIELTNVAGSVAENRVVTISGTNSAGTVYVGWVVDGITYYAAKSAAVYGYTKSGYTIDRWTKHAQGTVNIKNGYILLTGGDSDANYINLRQYLEKEYSAGLVGQTVTLSALTNKGLTTITGVVPEVPSSEVGILYKGIEEYGGIWLRWYNNETLFVQLRANADYSLRYYAVKLELGSQQTLARYENGAWILNDPPPNKQQELTKCQRYFVGQQKSASWSVATVTKGGYLMIPITLPVTLRSTSVTTSTSAGGAMQIYAGSWTDISGISYANYCTGNTMYLSASSSTYSGVLTLEQGMTYLVRNVPNVSADL